MLNKVQRHEDALIIPSLGFSFRCYKEKWPHRSANCYPLVYCRHEIIKHKRTWFFNTT